MKITNSKQHKVVKLILDNKFLFISILLLIAFIFIDITITIDALKNTGNQIRNMLLIIPPIFILIGLFDVWVPREKVIILMGEKSGVKGMFLAFLLGALSAGPTIASFPVAIIMLKKGAKYSNVLFFIMTWSTLKIPIILFQISQVGLELTAIINGSMVVVFILGAISAEKLFTKTEKEDFYKKANMQMPTKKTN
jgi:uncharacterized membrane protein YraQ (UPF0718 family)